MSPWIIVLAVMWGAWLFIIGWYLKKSFPDGQVELQAFRWKKTIAWGTYKKNKEVS